MTPAALGCNADKNGISDYLDKPTYDRLLNRAASILRREPRRCLFEPTDLVHDAFVRIANSEIPVRIRSADHLHALATIVMRRVMIDDSRSAKSPGHLRSVPLESENLVADPAIDAVVVRDALARLADYEDRLFRIVEMRFFGGLDMEEIALELDVSSRTVRRIWSAARERLHALLSA
jgi:RNA polymerase sigma factor (TIGR02999 family)